jgi:hypothetical protein
MELDALLLSRLLNPAQWAAAMYSEAGDAVARAERWNGGRRKGATDEGHRS